MKIQKEKFYTIIFVIVIFSQLYMSSFRFNTFLQITVLFLFLLFEKIIFTKSLLRQIAPLFLIFFIGLAGTLIHSYALVNIIKDIFHIIKPINGLLIGYLFYKKINDFEKFIRTIVVAGFVSAIIHFGTILLFSDITSVNGIRELARDNFLELFSFFFLIFHKKFRNTNLFQTKSKHYLYIGVLTLSCILYFSRTMIVSAIILLMSIYGYTYITRKGLKVITAVIILIGAFYMYLFSVKIDRNQPGLESFLFKIKNAPSEIFKTKIDRENHKDLWDHWRGYEAKRAYALMQENPSSFVFGNGYGSLVNLKFFAPLTENSNDKGLKFISELHNGFAYILYKIGILGLVIYLYFLIRLYKTIYDKITIYSIYISAIGLVYLFTTLTITGIYNSRDIIIFVLGALLFFESKDRKAIP